jgi:hypothetical protein
LHIFFSFFSPCMCLLIVDYFSNQQVTGLNPKYSPMYSGCARPLSEFELVLTPKLLSLLLPSKPLLLWL